MRFTPLSEIKDLEDGTVIEGIKGTVAKVMKRRTGEGEYGPYSYQDIQLTDGDLKITVSVGNKENLINFEKKFICILSGKDDKGRTSGIVVKDSEYQGKVKRTLKTNKLAEFTETIPASQIQQPAPKPQEQPQSQALPSGETAAQRTLREHREGKPPAPATAQKPASANLSAKGRLGQRVTLMYLCRKASVAIANQCYAENKLHQPSEDSINSMAVSMFIDSDREGLDRDLPSNFLKLNEPKAETPKPKLERPLPPPPPPEDEDSVPF